MQPLFCLRGLRWCSCHVCLVAVSCSERAWGWVWLGRGWTGISFFLFLMWLNNPITSALSSLSCHFLSYPLLCSSILPSFGFIISVSSPVLLSSFSFPLPSLSVYLSSPHPSAHIPPAFSSQSALKYMCVCVRVDFICLCTVVLHSAPCVKLSVHLSGFCGRSTPLHREPGIEWRGAECNLREWKAFRKRGKSRLGRNVGNEVWHRDAKMNWSELSH